MILLLLALVVPSLDAVLKLTNGTNFAHACPIAMDRAFTNRHVANAGSQWIWGVGDGEEFHGIAEVDGGADSFRDLAVVKPITAQRFPRWYPLAKIAPRVGDDVWLLGYDFEDERKAYGPKRFKATVTGFFNGHLIFKVASKGGSSGSCVLNQNEETVAINASGHDTENGGGVQLGVAVWGDWLSLKPDEPAVIE